MPKWHSTHHISSLLKTKELHFHPSAGGEYDYILVSLMYTFPHIAPSFFSGMGHSNLKTH